MDALEDDSPGFIWLWDLRQLTSLPKDKRKAASERKKAVKLVWACVLICQIAVRVMSFCGAACKVCQ